MAEYQAEYASYDTYLISLCVYMGLASLAVIIRFWARLVKRSTLWWDDWCVVMSLGLFWAVGGITLAARSRLDEDLNTMSRERIIDTRRFLYANICLAITTITFARISVLCLYYRLFSTTSRVINILLYVLGAVSIAWMISLLSATLLQCRPLGSYLDPFVERKCINTQVLFVVGEGVNCVLDAVLVCLPVPLIWRLTLGWKERVAVSGMFLLGGVVAVSSFIVIFKTYDPKSQRYDPMQGSLWVTLQLSSAIICACLPTYRPILRAHRRLLTPLSLQSFSSSSTMRKRKTVIQRSAEDMRVLEGFKFPGSPRKSRVEEWVRTSQVFGVIDEEVERPKSGTGGWEREEEREREMDGWEERERNMAGWEEKEVEDWNGMSVLRLHVVQ